MRLKRIAVICACVVPAGCAVFSSDSLVKPDYPDSGAVGISYALPKGVIRTKLVVYEPRATFAFCMLAKPVVVADPEYQYVMPFNNNAFSADKYTVLKDDVTGRLKSIDVTTVDKFDEFVVNLAKSAGSIRAAFESARPSGQELCDSPDAELLATIDIDPADELRMKDDLAAANEVLLRFARRKAQVCNARKPVFATGTAQTEIDAALDAYQACLEYGRVAKSYSQAHPPLFMRWLLPAAPRNPIKADCSVGFCYRHTLPHTVQLGMLGSSVHSYTYQLPNASPIVAMDINRAITVTKTTRIEFGELGQMTSITVKKGDENGAHGSEAAGLALLPATVINTYFQSFKATSDIIANSFTTEQTQIANTSASDQAKLDKANQQQDAVTKKTALEAAANGDIPDRYAVIASNGSVGITGLKTFATAQPQAPAASPPAAITTTPKPPAGGASDSGPLPPGAPANPGGQH